MAARPSWRAARWRPASRSAAASSPTKRRSTPARAITPGLAAGFLPSFSAGISLQGKVYLKPGTVTTVALDKKSFKGTSTRITLTGVRVKTDTCAGQSFIRSYATLTSSTDNTDDVITYLGVTKSV